MEWQGTGPKDYHLLVSSSTSTDKRRLATCRGISDMASVPELLDGPVHLEVECLDRLYLNGYIGKLATGPE